MRLQLFFIFFFTDEKKSLIMNPSRQQPHRAAIMNNEQIFASTDTIARITAMWEKVAKEKITVEYIDGTYYAYGSELAMLRLEHYYYGNPKAKAAFSTNLKTWYFRLEVA